MARALQVRHHSAVGRDAESASCFGRQGQGQGVAPIPAMESFCSVAGVRIVTAADIIAEIERLDCERAALMAQLRAMAKEPTASPCLCRRASQHGPRLELSVR